jgi:hypothetical protein
LGGSPAPRRHVRIGSPGRARRWGLQSNSGEFRAC